MRFVSQSSGNLLFPEACQLVTVLRCKEYRLVCSGIRILLVGCLLSHTEDPPVPETKPFTFYRLIIPPHVSPFLSQVSRMSTWWSLLDLASSWRFLSATASALWVSTSSSQPLASNGRCWCRAGSTPWTTRMERSKSELKSDCSGLFSVKRTMFSLESFLHIILFNSDEWLQSNHQPKHVV